MMGNGITEADVIRREVINEMEEKYNNLIQENAKLKQQNELIDNIRAECLSEIHNCYVEEKELNGSIKEILDLIKEYEDENISRNE